MSAPIPPLRPVPREPYPPKPEEPGVRLVRDSCCGAGAGLVFLAVLVFLMVLFRGGCCV